MRFASKRLLMLPAIGVCASLSVAARTERTDDARLLALLGRVEALEARLAVAESRLATPRLANVVQAPFTVINSKNEPLMEVKEFGGGQSILLYSGTTPVLALS